MDKIETTHTGQEQFNKIKTVIENSGNTVSHLKAISNMIENFERDHGINKLSILLQEEKLKLYGKI